MLKNVNPNTNKAGKHVKQLKDVLHKNQPDKIKIIKVNLTSKQLKVTNHSEMKTEDELID